MPFVWGKIINSEEEAEMKKAEPFYQRVGQEMIDMLYDKGFLDQSVSREAMRDLDSFMADMFQSYVDSAVRCAELTMKIREKTEVKQ